MAGCQLGKGLAADQCQPQIGTAHAQRFGRDIGVVGRAAHHPASQRCGGNGGDIARTGLGTGLPDGHRTCQREHC